MIVDTTNTDVVTSDGYIINRLNLLEDDARQALRYYAHLLDNKDEKKAQAIRNAINKIEKTLDF